MRPAKNPHTPTPSYTKGKSIFLASAVNHKNERKKSTELKRKRISLWNLSPGKKGLRTQEERPA